MDGGGGGGEDVGAPPETWEVADVEESMKRLMLRPSAKESAAELGSGTVSMGGDNVAGDGGGGGGGSGGVSEDALNQVDQFLREALQNPRERVSVLRIEQQVEKFIRDPMRQQLEFEHLPTSYLRLAAHRVAQHYSLQSIVLTDNTLLDGTGSKIIVHKTSNEYQLPRIRLADIPVNLPHEDRGTLKVAIKQRPQKHPLIVSNGNSSSVKANYSKSVEERKEEYNRARARIFNSSNVTATSVAKPESNKADTLPIDEKCVAGSSDMIGGRGLVESSTGSCRSDRSRVEIEPVCRYRPGNRVAIFRDHEIERSDPDYDRSYDRYMQRFDPGFGFNAGPYTVQPMYTPAINYNTEFPQLGSTHGPQVPAEAQLPPPPPHLHGPWASPSSPSGVSYGHHPDSMMTVYSPSHVNSRSTSAVYLHPSQYLRQHPGLPFVHTHEHIYRPYPQSQQPQHDSTLGLARPH